MKLATVALLIVAQAMTSLGAPTRSAYNHHGTAPCEYEGVTTSHGQSYTGETHMCICNNSKWEDCEKSKYRPAHKYNRFNEYEDDKYKQEHEVDRTTTRTVTETDVVRSTDYATVVETETKTKLKYKTLTDTDTKTVTMTDIEIETEFETLIHVETSAIYETVLTEYTTDIDSDTVTDTDIETSTKIETQTTTEAETETATDTKVIKVSSTILHTGSESVTETDTVTETETEIVYVTKAKYDPNKESDVYDMGSGLYDMEDNDEYNKGGDSDNKGKYQQAYYRATGHA
ncbi:hypothetical protein SARC_08589 [Sphaeroforma arctica JP610]|uniref:Uncharacterized protein n=1 Tax=Sphaeroforma arctica JP610 TaxID=667725 RepID=A0A0L0FQD7_9EUKA|nr:hypothetical protein SARC_08589 [Sphaeroforma arctica JP610]KNC79000.1 hypothetical protein SARC_08589 [Sphaeroforma arctica JP610]|eukprot:XP_014152902.1 hypothetical protein SARC_08589 [Sphaeroforma arctica JP610]